MVTDTFRLPWFYFPLSNFLASASSYTPHLLGSWLWIDFALQVITASTPSSVVVTILSPLAIWKVSALFVKGLHTPLYSMQNHFLSVPHSCHWLWSVAYRGRCS